MLVVGISAYIVWDSVKDDNIFVSATAEEIVSSYAEKHSIDYNEYPEELISLLSRNSDTKDFVLSYPEEHNEEHKIDLSEYKNCTTVPLFMQWDKRWGYIRYSGDIAGLTGCNNGKITVNDPNSYANSEKKWTYDEIKDQIENLWAIRNR